MARTRYAPDRGLTARMTVTMFLLGLVFVAFVAAIIGILTAVHASGAAIVLIALIFGGGSAIASLFYSDKIALSAAGAKVVTPREAPELHAIVDRLCALADMDKPRVAIAPTRMPNAFATGRNSKNSVLCVTEGLLHSDLDTEELEGVLAHELSHVAHKDVQVMTVASLLAIVAGLLVRFAFYSELFGGGRRSNNNQGGIPVVLIIMAVSVVVYAVSFLLIRVLSRYRELAADRSGALLTGQPSKLASALTKVSQGMSRIPNEDLRAAEPLNAFYFAPAMKLTRGGGGGGRSGGGGGKSLSQLFSTHPSLEKRLEQLAKIQRELGQPTVGGLSAGPGD
ncbi:MAG TPA: zinc metalloprotease HtpX [Trebonia sp.]|nr:zinc metalloprotease HtpX [Trebonia sp.]